MGTTRKKAKVVKEKVPERPHTLTSKEITDRLKKGWIRAIIVFELVGKPQAHIEQTIRGYIDTIRRDERIAFLNEEYAESEEHEDGMFSTFCETELLIDGLETVTWLSINFSPASVEILEPPELRIKDTELTNWYNDLISKLHEVSNVLREERSVNSHLTVSLNALIKNALKAALENDARTVEELSKILGIHHEQLAPFIKHLVEQKTLVAEGKSYRLA